MLWCCLLLTYPLFAQATTLELLELITQKESLSKRPVVDILQDSAGYIWFASPLDLSRYDGRTIQKHNNQASSSFSISSDNIKSIHQANFGDIVILYQSNLDFIDVLKRGEKSADQVFLTEENGVIGTPEFIYTDKAGVIHLLCELEEEYVIYGSSKDFHFSEKCRFDRPEDRASVHNFISTTDGSYWLNTTGLKVFQISKSGQFLQSFDLQSEVQVPTTMHKDYSEGILYEDQKKRIWFSAAGHPGLFRFEPQRNTFEVYAKVNPEKNYSKIWEDLLGNLIICQSRVTWGANGLYLLDTNEELRDISSLNRDYDKIGSIYGRDFSKLLFIGTYVGLKKVAFRNPNIQNYLNQELEEGEWGWSIRGMVETNDGEVFIAREQQNWYQFYPESQRLEKIPFRIKNEREESFLRNSFSLIYDPDGFLWGTRRGEQEDYHLVKYDLRTKEFEVFSFPAFIQSIGLSKDGKIWLGCGSPNTPGALYAFDKTKQNFSLFLDQTGKNPFESTEARYILESRDRQIWIGTKHGLFTLNTNRDSCHKIESKGKSLFANDNIVCIYENNQDELMLGTEGGGLNIFDPKTEVVSVYDESMGLCNNLVSGIVPDGLGNYWLSTYDGISYLNMKQKTFRNFYKSDGLSYNEFNRFSFLKDSDGRIYFGGMNGFNVFESEALLNTKSALIPPLSISKITRYNRSEDALITVTQTENIEQIRISPYDSYFQLDFYLPDYRNPEKNRYRYQLNGYDKSWNDLGNSNSIRYHDLPVGKYDLVIQGALPGARWGKHSLSMEVIIEELFYKTKLAFFLYLILLSSFSVLVYRMWSRRKMEIAEAKRLKELDDFKSRFYANISHEFRTPLTLISGPIDRAIDNIEVIEKEALLKDLKLAGRNSKRLLYLINRILDLSKLEAGKLEPEYVFGNMVKYLRYLTESFQSLTVSKQINLQFIAEVQNPKMDIDKQKMAHIFYNLLSNAIKFTPEQGEIMVKVQEQNSHLLISVQDSGTGIAPEKLEAIFERFHTTKAQNAMGAGIGLSFIKELVTIMSGEISARNNADRGATISITLPVRRTMQEEKTAKEIEPVFPSRDKDLLENITAEVMTKASDDRPLILIIEDQHDVAQFIRGCLGNAYRIQLASNGKVGTEKAIELIPDLIVSDVMMPEKNGLEVCNELKQDERTSHIPLILLTAKVDLDTKLKGLAYGADDYLAKPFSEKELKIRVANLLKSRKRLQQYFEELSQSGVQDGVSTNNEIPEAEHAFVQKARQVVIRHLENPKFDVQQFCREVGMSRTQLHRKLTALTGLSTIRFIRSIRLNKAKDLLKNTDLTISEIAYETGFNDPSYFTRTFSKVYAHSPSEFRAQS